MKGAPREKIVLEIPLSGRTYTAVVEPSGLHTVFPGHSGPYTKLQGFLAFFEVCSHIKSGWTRERFGEEACSFLKLADQYVAYEDDESISRKARMVMGRQYRGGALRSVDLGDYKGECKEKSYLLKALRSTLDITGYYVHFYYSPPNTTWWKEIEVKYGTTELPSDSTPSAEPNTTLLHTGNKTHGQPLNASATKESHWHTPFVPFVPA
ncbi:chitinase-3-like protein 1 [Rhipicephalus sanguineus]|uniref:chitinase-3-like protein 1 n=1 Tax=Rhipicephalus sanguineus TaxID=34632 RepID=UPI0020C21278|nr:chitinase-3-like protein 1 [Rhipicephalus sanguineus]